jgi:hypothetical protein
MGTSYTEHIGLMTPRKAAKSLNHYISTSIQVLLYTNTGVKMSALNRSDRPLVINNDSRR